MWTGESGKTPSWWASEFWIHGANREDIPVGKSKSKDKLFLTFFYLKCRLIEPSGFRTEDAKNQQAQWPTPGCTGSREVVVLPSVGLHVEAMDL